MNRKKFLKKICERIFLSNLVTGDGKHHLLALWRSLN